MQFRLTVRGAAVALLVWSVSAGPTALEAQVRRPLQPLPSGGLTVTPVLEGWYDNGDGTYTISFGYWNRNQEEVVEIPLGENNSIEPAEFDGMQPTTFLPGRHRGIFGVTISEDMRDEDLWWNIRNANGDVHRAPGRTHAAPYQLDWYPRPHGTLTPLVWFESEGNAGRGPQGVMAQETVTASVGSPVTLSVNVRDPSERDPDDPRTQEAASVRVVWSKYQGAGEVEFTRHESTPEPEPEEEEADAGPGGRGRGGRGGFRGGGPPGPETIMLPEGRGTALVYVTFSDPGSYVFLAQVDNWRAPDSSSGDQCCWSNGYVHVTVR